MLASSYPVEFSDPEYRYYLHIRQPSLPLPDYFRGVRSDQGHWSTCLRISPKETRAADLVSVSSISNLALLDLSDGQVTIDTKNSSFDERVMRTWTELAETEGAFACLQALLLGWQENVSAWLFRYLRYFPSLRYIILTDCPLMHQKNRKEWEPFALDHGWEARHAKRSAKSLRPVLKQTGFHFGAVSGLLYPSTAEQNASVAEGVSNPILEVWLGTPKPWTHIVDDFPSTRTIFFDRQKRSSIGSGPQRNNDDLLKRSRMSDERAVEVRSPPAKRTVKPTPGMRPGSKLRGTSDLLADVSYQR